MRIGEHVTLKRSEEFQRCYKQGRMAKNAMAVVHVLPNDDIVKDRNDRITRIGISVSTKLGKAVVRNRVKRRLREALRRLPLAKGYDVVVSARGKVKRAPFAELERALRDLCESLGILEKGMSAGVVSPGATDE